ncbi:uncharacterized protein JCM10292_004567 [Rhodotorula paludigena]|uniref:uncharacterized protein n=1 Tax=Rhodotorula paludigena TaxID=86838 RepID=UPI00317D200E
MSLPLHTGAQPGSMRSRRPSPSRPPALALGNASTSPRLGAGSPADGTLSPHSPAFYSPSSQLGGPLSPVTNHFSTLPPSPPLVTAELPSVGGVKRASVAHAYPTPPASAPGSARPHGGFDTAVDMNGVSSSTDRQPTRGSSVLLGEDLRNDGDPSIKRRPSLILTSAPSEEPEGLAIGIDMGDGSAPSPLLGRSFSGSTSPLNSPVQPYFSTSPVGSPTFSAMSSPHLSAGSPTLGAGGATMERVPSSPRLAAFTDPLGRLATGLVRRASSNSLDTDLPTSIKRSPSPVPPSPTLPSVPSLSPTLGSSGPIRRTSFANAAREKEREKEKEVKERQEQARAKGHHSRMFSWAVRPDDPVLARRRASGGPSPGWKKRALGVIAVIILGLLLTVGRRFRPTPRARPPLRERMSMGQRLRRAGGSSFIHPGVISGRQEPEAKGWFQRAKGAVVADGTKRLQSRAPVPRQTGKAVPAKAGARAEPVENKPKEYKAGFRPSPHVEFVDHKALPPPVEHNDAPERDTLVLYRILGNDLPPRHSPGQTLRNLRFLLQHESDFSVLPPLGPHGKHHSSLYGSGNAAREAHTQMGGLRVDKYFVLNRIAEPEMVSAIIGLLHLYSVPDSRILVIPFEWDEYQRREFRWDGGVDAAKGWGIGDAPLEESTVSGNRPVKWHHVEEEAVPDDLSILLEEADGDEARVAEEHRLRKREMLGRLRALDFTYHEKNLYAMNNNGGRNFALQHGRSLPNARWILPLDGNSFFTPAAMYSIVRTLSIAGEGPAASRYVIIPMARLLDNEDIRVNNSVSLVPLLDVDESASAIVDAEIHHRPAVAPDTPEEPQVGFRYDSTESFQEAMRYGRRSKLELLWRLGAIPYSRGLDRRTLPWEVTDRAHITAKTWGSIPGVEGAATQDSIIHAPHGELDPWGEPNPERGALAYVKAGWTYRLFSGHKSQEEHSSEAATLRNTNRIRGIVAFLEHLDELVARGERGCTTDENPFHCGFHEERLWNFDMFEVERLRQKFRLDRRDAVEKIERYERLVGPTLRDVMHVLKDPHAMRDLHAQKAATASTLLAMAGYVTGNSSYSNAASSLIHERFTRKTPQYYYHVDHHDLLFQQRDGAHDAEPMVPDIEQESIGYAFPPTLKDPNEVPTYSAELAAQITREDAAPLPFDPATFDPIFLLDAIRLLTHPSGPKLERPSQTTRQTLTPLLNQHLSWLLFSREALAFSANPPTAEAGAYYDAKVAALAAFLDDIRLVGRVANRARLRLPKGMRAEGLMDPAPEVRDVHFRLMQGLSNTKTRPWSLLSDPVSEARYLAMHFHGGDTPFSVLGL